jgi:hypothetical protein
MEQVLCEPVELTEFELDAVAGGNPFSINIAAAFSAVSATVNAALANASENNTFTITWYWSVVHLAQDRRESLKHRLRLVWRQP